MGRYTPFPALLGAALLCAACGDAEPCRDSAAHRLDAGHVSETGTPAPDSTPAADQGTPATCSAGCGGEAPYLCVKDPASGQCVECLSDGHCAANKESLGKVCRNKLCVCDKDADCAGKQVGGKCQGSGPMWCGCEASSDCTGGRICAGKLFSSTVCVPPCKVDADCKYKDRPICDTSSGKCEICLTDSHCAKAKYKNCHPSLKACVACKRQAHCTSATAPLCNTKKGTCVTCLADSDCKASINGDECSSGACTCKADEDCKGPNVWGNICSKSDKRCGCSSSTDCTNNPNGPTCYTKYHKCSCAADTDCKKTPYSKCIKPYSSATYSHCQMACSADTDCPDSLFPACSTSTAKCIACTADKHCTTDTFRQKCSKGRCAECLKDADCTAKSLGPTCASGQCSCAKDADCAANDLGHRCHLNLRVCACVKDSDCASGKTCSASTSFGSGVCK